MSALRNVRPGDGEGMLVIVASYDPLADSVLLDECHLRRAVEEGLEGVALTDRSELVSARRVYKAPEMAFPDAAGEEELLEASARARAATLYAVKRLINRELAEAINVLEALEIEEEVTIDFSKVGPLIPAAAAEALSSESIATAVIREAGLIRAELEAKVRKLEDTLEVTRRRLAASEARNGYRGSLRGIDGDEQSTGGEVACSGGRIAEAIGTLRDYIDPHATVEGEAVDLLDRTIATQAKEIEHHKKRVTQLLDEAADADEAEQRLLDKCNDRIEQVNEQAKEIGELTRERDAYKRAKAENDERFMGERDDAGWQGPEVSDG